MNKHLRTQFVIADGAHARWVRRAEGGGDFATTGARDAAQEAHGHPQGVVFEGVNGRRATVEARLSAAERARDRFAAEVAEAINAEAAEGAFDRLVIVAPTHTLAAIRHALSPAAQARLVGTLAKDLVKVPDHALGDWLRSLEL